MHRLVIRNQAQKIRANKWVSQIPLEPTYEVIIRKVKVTRSLEQNAKLWALLSDIAEQVEWYDEHLSREDWKHLFTAQLRGLETKNGIDGGLVTMGQSTSRMSIGMMSNLIELMYAFGAERNVEWSEW